MREIEGYKIDGKLFIIPLVVSILLLSGLVYMEGFSVFSQTKTYSCPTENFGPCDFKGGISIEPGVIITFNQQDNVLVELFNYVPLILLCFSLVYNHYKHNNKK